jgi:Leucine-rich repeat (LRR) protein
MNLTSLPGSLSCCSGLKRLVLTSNRFALLPPVIAALETLKFLDVSNNMITEIPYWFGQLKSVH